MESITVAPTSTAQITLQKPLLSKKLLSSSSLLLPSSSSLSSSSSSSSSSSLLSSSPQYSSPLLIQLKSNTTMSKNIAPTATLPTTTTSSTLLNTSTSTASLIKTSGATVKIPSMLNISPLPLLSTSPSPSPLPSSSECECSTGMVQVNDEPFTSAVTGSTSSSLDAAARSIFIQSTPQVTTEKITQTTKTTTASTSNNSHVVTIKISDNKENLICIQNKQQQQQQQRQYNKQLQSVLFEPKKVEIIEKVTVVSIQPKSNQFHSKIEYSDDENMVVQNQSKTISSTNGPIDLVDGGNDGGDGIVNTNNNKSTYLYYMVPSGQCSPSSDTMDSGTCSDLENSPPPPPLPKKMSTKSTTKLNQQNNNNRHHHPQLYNHHQHLLNNNNNNNKNSQQNHHRRRGVSFTDDDSEESESSLSCDSLNSSELNGINGHLIIKNVVDDKNINGLILTTKKPDDIDVSLVQPPLPPPPPPPAPTTLPQSLLSLSPTKNQRNIELSMENHRNTDINSVGYVLNDDDDDDDDDDDGDVNDDDNNSVDKKNMLIKQKLLISLPDSLLRDIRDRSSKLYPLLLNNNSVHGDENNHLTAVGGQQFIIDNNKHQNLSNELILLNNNSEMIQSGEIKNNKMVYNQINLKINNKKNSVSSSTSSNNTSPSLTPTPPLLFSSSSTTSSIGSNGGSGGGGGGGGLGGGDGGNGNGIGGNGGINSIGRTNCGRVIDIFGAHQQTNGYEHNYENDRFYKFHINERFVDNDEINTNNNVRPPGSLIRDDESFAGYKDIHSGTSTIRSSKGTVRGVKNRVRNGIQTFLQMQQTNVKNYKEKDAGKVVLYTTSMGIVRQTYAKCANVKQILRTLLVKFEERDVFMSIDYQQEVRDRMQSDDILIPQLYVDGQHIGDADQVERLNESGELRQMLKPYKATSPIFTCQTCGGYRLLPCPSCKGSKKSVHRNHFTTEFVALKCMNCDEVGLVKCYNC